MALPGHAGRCSLATTLMRLSHNNATAHGFQDVNATGDCAGRTDFPVDSRSFASRSTSFSAASEIGINIAA